jgi:glycosyltransferase involved in cell wall biosynthesis
MGDVVHTYYWPVLQRQAWVADFDECGYPFLSGRYTWHPDFQREFAGDWSSDFLARMRRRTVAMMEAYSHPSCKGMIFWSNYALNHVIALFDRLNLPQCAATVRQKGLVVYPAQRVLTQDRFTCKWRDDRLRIVFCGRDYAMKNGQLALSVYRRLLASGFPLTLVYIGEIPPGPLERFGDVIESIEYYPVIDHRQCLAIIASSHVLFHPSRGEAFGIVFLEAAAAGLAIVTAGGPMMLHVPELTGTEGAVFVDREIIRTEEEEEQAFYECLVRFIRDRKLVFEAGLSNWLRTAEGSLSIGKRDAALRSLYRGAVADPAPDVLDLSAMQADSNTQQQLSLSARDLARDLSRFLAIQKRGREYIVLSRDARITHGPKTRTTTSA